MKLLGEVAWNVGIPCHQYADDTQLYLSLLFKSEEAILVLDQCLMSVMDWMRMNKMRLNPDKTGVLPVKRKANRRIGMQSVLDRVTLPLKTQVHSLGIFLHSVLSLDAQVFMRARSAFAQLKHSISWDV